MIYHYVAVYTVPVNYVIRDRNDKVIAFADSKEMAMNLIMLLAEKEKHD